MAGVSVREPSSAERRSFERACAHGAPAALREHLRTYGGGPTAEAATAALADLEWRRLGADPSPMAAHRYAAEFPNAPNAAAARALAAGSAREILAAERAAVRRRLVASPERPGADEDLAPKRPPRPLWIRALETLLGLALAPVVVLALVFVLFVVLP